MNHELYVSGKRIDLSVEAVTLQYRSNILGDIASITSSNSLTIQVPKTPNNNSVFQFSDDVVIGGRYGHDWYDAIYIRNGVRLIEGKIALLSSTYEHYELCLVWGIFPQIEEWVKSDETLRDLPLDDYTSIVAYSSGLFPRPAPQRVGYVRYDNGIGYKEGINIHSWFFPFVNVGWVWSTLMTHIDNVISTSRVDTSVLDLYYMNFTEDLVKETYVDGRIEPFQVKSYIPAIKQIDFFKAICQMFGWYVEKMRDGALVLVEFSELSDKSRYVDWSGKLISRGTTPDKVDYNYNNYAQRNWMRYKVDDTVESNADGYIRVDNRTIDNDRDIVVLPFANTDGNTIKQYTRSVDEENVETLDFIKTEPRILRLNPNSPVTELYFTPDMYFEQIIASKYNYYQQVLESPLVITTQMLLTEFDLTNIDFTRPIYISRYGCYFAIIEVQNSGDVSDVKMIKLV